MKNNHSNARTVLIIGAGAAGLMAGIRAAEKDPNRQVLIAERMERPGRKLLITGKGRCNVTNCCTIEEFMPNVLTNPRFLYSSLNALSPYEVMGFFEECGVPLKVERGERVFPVSDHSSDIVNALVQKAKDSGCRFLYNCRIKELLLEQTDDGQSPLAKMTDWVNTTCPHCGGPAKRETDTMPQWAGSSWYYLRYCDPHNDECLASKEALDYWCPVDWYNGGMEHTTLHLLYSRFWHKFLYDIGIVSNPEPYAKRTSHGMILGENGEKMSKSRGNVVNPDDIVREYGADTMRLYEMFIGDFEKSAPWSTSSIKGCKRFLDRVWALQDILNDSEEYSKELESAFHKAIKKVGEDIEEMKFNTAIATLMALINDVADHKSISRKELATFLILLNPFAPHITEEIWEEQNFGGMLNQQSWPEYDEAKCVDATVEIAVQISGKIKARINVPTDATKEQLLAAAKENGVIASILEGKTIVKEIVVPGKLVNIVAK